MGPETHSSEAGTSAFNLDYELQRFLSELDMQAQNPPAGDEFIAAYSAAFKELLTEDLGIRRELSYYYAQRHIYDKQYGPSYTHNKWLRAIQKQLMRNAEIQNYPSEAWKQPGRWRAAITDILANDLVVEEFEYDVIHRETQSNVAERYKSFKLIMLMLRDRLGVEPSVLDIGCSQNHGLMKLATGFHFGKISAVELDSEGRPHTDYEVSSKVNRLLKTRLILGPSVGVDAIPLKIKKRNSIADEFEIDPATREWVKACSFYPSELLDESLVHEYDMLDRIDSVNVGFEWLDIVDKSLELGEGFFDAVTLSTVLYQASDQDRLRMQEVAKRYIKPDGIVIYQDFAVKDRDDPTRLHFHETWFNDRFPYHTLVYDPHNPEELQDIFGWENGRCTKMIAGLGRLVLNGTKITFSEYLDSLPH